MYILCTSKVGRQKREPIEVYRHLNTRRNTCNPYRNPKACIGIGPLASPNKSSRIIT